MRLIVPAFLDWDAFQIKCPWNGGAARADLHDATTLFVDDYGSDKEIGMIKRFWPDKMVDHLAEAYKQRWQEDEN